MSIDLLDTPLRVTWDLHGEKTSLGEEDALRVADALSTAGLFFSTLEERPLLHVAIRGVLDTLAAGGVQVLLVCDGSDLELDRLTPGLPIATLFLNAAPFVADGRADIPALNRAVDRVRARGYEPALLMTPLRGNIRALPGLLGFCRQVGMGKFKLPNVKIGDSFCRSRRPDLLQPQDIEALKTLLGADRDALRAGIALEVHDLFLWELLFSDGEEGRSEYGGCQAGNSLAHVDGFGELYPCSSWPQRLGSLLSDTLEDLWASPLRHAVRNEIAEVPAGCAGCRDYPLCFGGCRGLARSLPPGPGGRDPLCAGRR